MGPETYRFESDTGFPTQQLPVLVYRDVEACYAPSECKELFSRNGWLELESVPLPDADPIHGPDGPLITIWRPGPGASSPQA